MKFYRLNLIIGLILILLFQLSNANTQPLNESWVKIGAENPYQLFSLKYADGYLYTSSRQDDICILSASAESNTNWNCTVSISSIGAENLDSQGIAIDSNQNVYALGHYLGQPTQLFKYSFKTNTWTQIGNNVQNFVPLMFSSLTLINNNIYFSASYLGDDKQLCIVNTKNGSWQCSSYFNQQTLQFTTDESNLYYAFSNLGNSPILKDNLRGSRLQIGGVIDASTINSATSVISISNNIIYYLGIDDLFSNNLNNPTAVWKQNSLPEGIGIEEITTSNDGLLFVSDSHQIYKYISTLNFFKKDIK